jgi:hypothetical protein
MFDSWEIRKQIFHKYNREIQDTRIKLINYCTVLNKEKLCLELLEHSIDFLSSNI